MAMLRFLQAEKVRVDYVNNTMPVPVTHRRLPPIPLPLIGARPSAATPTDIFNAPGNDVVPHAPMGGHAARLTEADGIIAALYQKMVKYGDRSTVNVDLDTLGQVLAGSGTHADTNPQRRISNIYLGKALNILCKLTDQRGALALDERLLSTVARTCVQVVAARQAFTLENASVIMFHLGELMNHAPLQQVCSQTIIDHMVPIFEALVRQHPVHAIAGATLAFGLVSALRACTHELARRGSGPLPPPAVDRLLLLVPELLAAEPDLLEVWETRTLTLLANYGVQYLRQLDLVGQRRGRLPHAERLQQNAARAIKPVIEEARRFSRGVWDQRDSTFRGFTPFRGVKELRDYLAYCALYYGKWLQHKPEWMKDRFGLQEAERGPIADNPQEGRNFAAVVRQGMSPAPEVSAACALPPPTPVPARRPLSLDIAPAKPPAELARFSQAAGDLTRLGEAADRFDRKEAIAAANALILSIEAGRTTLSGFLRVQMLLDMDCVCMRLYEADSFDAPQYAGQLQRLRGFLSSQLALVVDADGRPLLGTDVPFASGLSSWQRSLLDVIIEHECEG